jgi:serine/threonine protein kinase
MISDGAKTLHFDALERIDRACTRFEQAWRSGPRPDLRDYLAGTGDERTALFCELLKVELECRLNRGEQLDALEYRQRFPEDEISIAAAFEDVHRGLARPDEASGGRLISPRDTYVLLEAAAAQPAPLREVLAGDSSEAQRGATAEVAPASPPGYELLDKIGSGGMGVVYRALDVALGRQVAVKILSERYAPASPASQRFLSEARITGQLQHPGVPAVHQAGTLPDGRPFLAMKLIKGDTLDAILKERADPSAERGRLLGVFEAVCQAVGYAHAHRVIHRDLKPANVMVGAYGEVQVMDWGLAKVLDEQTPSAADPLAAEQARAWTEVSPPPDAGSYTQAGSLVGTPAFIPPEQAVGEIDRVNERSDVFGLGALLAVILTGQPPYVGETVESVRVQALRGKLADCFARLDASGAEPELVALCKKCLAFEPGDRPRDAGEVAEAVAGLRAAAEERAQSAERERLAAEVRAAEQTKRRKTLQRATAAVVAVLLLGVAGTTAGLIQADHQRRTAEQAQEDESRQRQAALAAQATAESEAQRANREAATADQVSEFLVGLFEPQDRVAFGAANLGFIKSQEGLRARDLLARGVRRLNAAELKGQPLVRARLLHEIGTIYLGHGDTEAAAPLLDEALKLRRAHLPADHPDLARSLSGIAMLRFATGDWSCIDHYQEAIAILKKQSDPETLELAEAESGLAVCLDFTDRQQAIELYTHALKIRRARLGEHDLQTLTTIFLLAVSHPDFARRLVLISELLTGLEKSSADPLLAEGLRKATRAVQKEFLGGRAEDILPIWREVVGLLTKLGGDDHYLTAFAKRKLATLIYERVPGDDPRLQERLEEAARLYEEGMGVGPPWMRNLSRMDLARTLMRLGRGAEAEPHLLQVVAQLRKEPPKLFAGREPHALQLLAWIAARSGEPQKQARVEGLLEQALEAARANPDTPPGRTGLALRDVAIYRLSRKKDAVASAPLFAESARLFIKSEGPTDLRVAEALAYQSLALRIQGKTQEADALRQQAESIERRHASDQGKLAWEVRLLLKGQIPPWPGS